MPWLFITFFGTFFGELIFMLWLLIFGWRLREPIPGKSGLGF
jgi:hypothetical protein